MIGSLVVLLAALIVGRIARTAGQDWPLAGLVITLALGTCVTALVLYDIERRSSRR